MSNIARLGDICEIVSGATPKTNISSYWDGCEKWITPAELDESTFLITDSVRHISIDAITQTGLRLLPAGTVILSSRAPIGKVAIAGCPLYCNQGFKNLICSNQVNNVYLYFFLFSKTAFLNSLGRGATFKEISKNIVADIQIPLPPLEQQEKIAKRLLKIRELLTIKNNQLQKLDQLAKSRFIEMFGDPMTNSKGFVLKTYGELFELNAGGTPSKQKSAYWDNGTISWIGSNMCQNTVIYKNDGIYITEEGLNHSSARIFPVDTVLIALVGATIGKTALLKFESATNQNVLGVRGIREHGYTPEFVFYYTQGLYKKFLQIGDGGFSMASKGFISNLPMPIVEFAQQKDFSAFIEQLDKSKVTIRKSIEKLETTYRALLQEYFG